MPRTKGIKEEPLTSTFSSRPNTERLGGRTTEGQGQNGAALGNVDVVTETFIQRPFIIALPWRGLEAIANDGVVLEDEEERSLAEMCEGDVRGVDCLRKGGLGKGRIW